MSTRPPGGNPDVASLIRATPAGGSIIAAM
jgi:hypothetical protein